MSSELSPERNYTDYTFEGGSWKGVYRDEKGKLHEDSESGPPPSTKPVRAKKFASSGYLVLKCGGYTVSIASAGKAAGLRSMGLTEADLCQAYVNDHSQTGTDLKDTILNPLN